MKHKPTKQWDILKVEGGQLKRGKKPCPRCGAGVYMAEHKDRYYCGTCHFTEWKKKSRLRNSEFKHFLEHTFVLLSYLITIYIFQEDLPIHHSKQIFAPKWQHEAKAPDLYEA